MSPPRLQYVISSSYANPGKIFAAPRMPVPKDHREPETQWRLARLPAIGIDTDRRAEALRKPQRTRRGQSEVEFEPFEGIIKFGCDVRSSSRVVLPL